jgi:hypothetical protein
VTSDILLDEPPVNPALGYGAAARALGQIIQHSTPPRFAVGIFGGWGSGKTTLMDAIKSDIITASGLVVVEFNAWRYEREPQLLVPLLDTIRAALIKWSKDKEGDAGGKVRDSALRIGRVVRALAGGLSVGVGLPGAATVNFDLNTALTAMSTSHSSESAQSVYFAAFEELKTAFDEFKTGGVNRIAVFVDDLDRCLPENALQVLESMKLFFDIEGFIFIAGLDPDVVARAVESKFFSHENGSQAAGSSYSTFANTLGVEYIQKIFQVQYRLPPVYPDELEELLGSMLGVEPSELKETVLPYLKHLATDGRINPREVKRLINDFILDSAISDAAPNRSSNPAPRPDTMLALRVLQFRSEWALIYNALLTDPDKFQKALKAYRDGDSAAFVDLAPQLKNLPKGAEAFLVSPEVCSLTGPSDLRPYLSAIKSISGAAWFRGAGELFMAIMNGIDKVKNDNLRDGAEALRQAQKFLSDPALDVGTYLSTAESKVPAEFYVLQLEVERARTAPSSGEVDEGAAFTLLSNIIFAGAKATISAAPPY